MLLLRPLKWLLRLMLLLRPLTLLLSTPLNRLQTLPLRRLLPSNSGFRNEKTGLRAGFFSSVSCAMKWALSETGGWPRFVVQPDNKPSMRAMACSSRGNGCV
jgi:hypothetical protein